MKIDPLERSPGYRLQRVSRLLRAHLLGLLAPTQLTPEQYFVLMRLQAEDGVPQGTLGDRTLDDRGSVSRQIAGLERRGLVRREQSQDDRRSVSVHLTEAGRGALDALTPVVVRERHRLFGAIPEEDLAAFDRMIDHLEALLE